MTCWKDCAKRVLGVLLSNCLRSPMCSAGEARGAAQPSLALCFLTITHGLCPLSASPHIPVPVLVLTQDGPAAAGRHPRAQAARAVGQEAQVLRLQRHRSRVIP